MSFVVLVTGGSGFVGQHVIGLLQTRAPHVTEIRNLDLNPFENKLGKPSQQIQRKRGLVFFFSYF